MEFCPVYVTIFIGSEIVGSEVFIPTSLYFLITVEYDSHMIKGIAPFRIIREVPGIMA